MTTTVMIAVQGNKEVSIETPIGRMVLPPGKWVHGLQIHGEQSLKIAETGGFVDAGPGVRFEDANALTAAQRANRWKTAQVLRSKTPPGFEGAYFGCEDDCAPD